LTLQLYFVPLVMDETVMGLAVAVAVAVVLPVAVHEAV
jgi:hypothetical protein